MVLVGPLSIASSIHHKDFIPASELRPLSLNPQDSLPQIASVCRGWRNLVKDGNLWAQAFITSWKLGGVSGEPSSTGFWRGKLSQFAISHDLARGDSIASLAVKYNVQVSIP